MRSVPRQSGATTKLFDIWKIHIQEYFFSMLVILLLSGCARESLAESREISQQGAIDVAVRIASVSMPEISGSQVAPSNIQAEKMRWEDAVKRLNLDPKNVSSETSPEAKVWLVSMDGIWLPASVPDVVQEPYRHLSLIIDPQTGLEILRNMRP